VSTFDSNPDTQTEDKMVDGTRDEVLKKLKSIEKRYPGIDFSPLFVYLLYKVVDY
jgi:uncharacterized protein YggT (Ycf19 family)